MGYYIESVYRCCTLEQIASTPGHHDLSEHRSGGHGIPSIIIPGTALTVSLEVDRRLSQIAQ
jgi:hypothetical protein